MIEAIGLTLKLASISSLVLLLLATLTSLFLIRFQRAAPYLLPLISLPLVLPPTVLGFYLLLLFSPSSSLGVLGFADLAFTFEGLLLGSIIYSFPFVFQPIHNAICAVPKEAHELAATLGASAFDRFLSVTLPLAKNGFIAAAILGFAHTIGEFGVVLMVGGNIPGETQVLSVLLFEAVEMGDYQVAHKMAALLLLVSLVLLLLMYRFSAYSNNLFAVPRAKGASGMRGRQ